MDNEKAYIYGYVIGNVKNFQKKKLFTIFCHSSEFYVLEKIKQILNVKNKIKYCSKNNENCIQLYKIDHPELFKYINDNFFPDLERDLELEFLRGYIDGFIDISTIKKSLKIRWSSFSDLEKIKRIFPNCEITINKKLKTNRFGNQIITFAVYECYSIFSGKTLHELLKTLYTTFNFHSIRNYNASKKYTRPDLQESPIFHF